MLFVVLSALAYSCHHKEKNTPPDLHKKRPTSPVIKKIEHYVTDSSNTEMLLEVDEFNNKGQKVKLTRYQKKDTIDYETTFTPDAKGNPAKTVSRYLDSSTETNINTYDKKGHVIKTEWQRSDGTKGRHEYKYDDHDSLVEWDRYENGKYLVSQLWPNVYDKNDRVIESWYKETNNGKDTSTMGHWQYDYDSVGRLTHRLTLQGPALQTAEEFYYDSLGSQIMVVEYGQDTTKQQTYTALKRTINVFNEYGEMLSSQTLDAAGKELEHIENQYDQYGHLIQSEITRTRDGIPFTEKHRWVYSYY